MLFYTRQIDCFKQRDLRNETDIIECGIKLLTFQVWHVGTMASIGAIISPFTRTLRVKKHQQVQHVQRLTVPRRHLSVADQASRRVAPAGARRVVRCPSQFNARFSFFCVTAPRDIFHRPIDDSWKTFVALDFFNEAVPLALKFAVLSRWKSHSTFSRIALFVL